ncbi:unnamed protein product, partial [Brenthis ino]
MVIYSKLSSSITVVWILGKKQPKPLERESVDYILTEFEVIFNFEGVSSKGYISGGGILQNHINLTFVFTNTTSLSFQFYLYGVPSSLFGLKGNSFNLSESFVDLC